MNDSYVRQAAAGALVQLDHENPAVIDALLKALGDSDSDVRQAAAGALGQLKTATAPVIDALLKALGDKV